MKRGKDRAGFWADGARNHRAELEQARSEALAGLVRDRKEAISEDEIERIDAKIGEINREFNRRLRESTGFLF